MKDEVNGQKVVIVAGPKGFDVQSALFAEGVDIDDADVLVAIERPGNLEVEILEPDAE